MLQSVVHFRPMPDIDEYVSTTEAAKQVPYTGYWIRKLVETGKVPGRKVGGAGRGGKWLIHLPSLLKYAKEMESLGTDKHNPS